MLTRVAAVAALALALPVVPAHAADAPYDVKASCVVVASFVASYERIEYALVATATSSASGGAVPVSTTVRCRFYDALNDQTYWSGVQAAPGAAAATAGQVLAYADMGICASGSATFSDGQIWSTPDC